ncbi:MAG: alpha/beta fold hydrolase [Bacteroidetes bacterium]|nr:alpha/beta fold hydrolase [Bacteroidota bacterium]
MRLIIIVFSITLTGCGLFLNSLKLKDTSNKIISISDSSIIFADNTRLYLNQKIFQNSKPIVVCIHGMGAHTKSFDYLNKFLNEDSISTFAYDLKGFGRSTGDRGRIDNFGTYLDELDQIIELLHHNYSPRKIVLLGESLGSSLILWYGSEYKNSKYDSSILTSLTTTFGAGNTNFFKLFELFFWYVVNPNKRIFIDKESEDISKDSLFVNRVDSTDIYAQKEISISFLLQTKYLKDHIEEFSKNYNKSVLFINGSEDFLSTDEDMKEIYKLIPAKKKSYFRIEGGTHSLLNDDSRYKGFKIIKKWLNKLK